MSKRYRDSQNLIGIHNFNLFCVSSPVSFNVKIDVKKYIKSLLTFRPEEEFQKYRFDFKSVKQN